MGSPDRRDRWVLRSTIRLLCLSTSPSSPKPRFRRRFRCQALSMHPFCCFELSTSPNSSVMVLAALALDYASYEPVIGVEERDALDYLDGIKQRIACDGVSISFRWSAVQSFVKSSSWPASRI